MNSVYLNKSACCGCKSCASICPVHAISMVEDEYGFTYPQVDSATCIDCGRCKTVCPMLDVKGKPVSDAYAVVLDDEAVGNSASGGAFYALAKAFLENGGVVFGCAFDEHLQAAHVEISRVDELCRLQGSKYVQSDMDCHRRILSLVKQGTPVLFSGTPCQVAAIQSFVGEKSDKLCCVELICHGVPSARLWKAYIDSLGQKHKGTVRSFRFRTKGNGKKWCASYMVDVQGKKKQVFLPAVLSHYYSSFLKGRIYRDSCYACPFAQPDRQADVTIGDFWGYQGQAFRGRTDVSALLIQSEKGRQMFDHARKYLRTETSSFELVAAQNEQLRKPTSIQKRDEMYLNLWKTEGMKGLEREHRAAHWKAYLLHLLGRL